MDKDQEIKAKAWELTLLYAGPQSAHVARFNVNASKPLTDADRIKELAPIAAVFESILKE